MLERTVASNDILFNAPVTSQCLEESSIFTFSGYVLEFGVEVDGHPDIVASCDILGMQLFYYDKWKKHYVEQPRHFLWKIPLSKFRNIDVLKEIPWPGGWDIDHYVQFGYDSLGYVAAVWNNPKLAEYVDNPGLLIIILSNPGLFESLSLKGVKRTEIVRLMTRRERVSYYQIRWLKRVAPEIYPPYVLFPKIVESLLYTSDDTEFMETDPRQHDIKKLFSHQAQWRLEGLDLACKLVTHPTADPKVLAWMIDSHNGHAYPEVLATYRNLQALSRTPGVPEIVKERIHRLLTNGLPYTPTVCRQINRAWDASQANGDPALLAMFFLSDLDIATPRIAENDVVKSLDTLSKIEKHAKLAGNCINTMAVLAKLVSREYDLYAMQSESLYTFSVYRRTLDIGTIETAKGSRIQFDDLAKIISWFEEGTSIVRSHF